VTVRCVSQPSKSASCPALPVSQSVKSLMWAMRTVVPGIRRVRAELKLESDRRCSLVRDRRRSVSVAVVRHELPQRRKDLHHVFARHEDSSSVRELAV
jgi:hypothetical protein